MDANTYNHDAPLPQPKRVVTPCLKEIVDLGFQLIQLKVTCKHGQFLQRVKELGFRKSEPSVLMAIARRFNCPSAAPILEAVGNFSKLRELLSLNDDELESLKNGGEARGITLYSLKSMTITQVRLTMRRSLSHSAMLSADEARMLKDYRQRAKEVTDVADRNAVPYWEPRNDLFSSRCMVTL